MTETELLVEIQDLLERHREIRWHHCGDSRRCGGKTGLPDLVIAGPGGLLFAELKTDTADTSAAQDAWHWLLSRPGVRVEIWRPQDLADGFIALTLARIAEEPE